MEYVCECGAVLQNHWKSHVEKHLVSARHLDYLNGTTKNDNTHVCSCGCVISTCKSVSYKHKKTLKHIIMSRGGTQQDVYDLRYWRKRLAEAQEIEKQGGTEQHALERCKKEIRECKRLITRLENKFLLPNTCIEENDDEDENIIEARKIMRGEI